MCMPALPLSCFFFFNDTATTEIYTLSLHDALPISQRHRAHGRLRTTNNTCWIQRQRRDGWRRHGERGRSEEHTSELQSQSNLVCRLLLEKKNTLHNDSTLRQPVTHSRANCDRHSVC